MIDRYSRPEMTRVWSAEARYAKWLEVELAVVEARARRGEVPADVPARIKAQAHVDPRRIAEIEARVKHDVIAFLENLEEAIGDDSRYVHVGMTSSDVLDTSLALQLQEASRILLAALEGLRDVLRRLAVREKDTVMVGRTHGVHAEITTFGLKLAVWYAEAERNLERLRRAKEAVRVGKLSGAVGTYAHLDPSLEAEVCRTLGLEPAPVSTQIIQRDRHAEYLTTLALIGASLEKFATEIRNLQRSEILEVEEPFGEGQKGSSAMPHKRNPVGCEQVCGLARLLRANALASLENIALWHERDISHSSVERVILPDSTILLNYLLHRFTAILEGLQVYRDRMRENLDRSYGLVFSERVLLALAEKGLARQKAYELTQRCAMRAWRERRSFEAVLGEDQEVTGVLGPEGVRACFDPAWPLRHVDAIFRRLGLLS